MFELYFAFMIGLAFGIMLTMFISWINSMRQKLKDYENEKEVIRQKQKEFDMK